MSNIIIRGCNRLHGSMKVQGSKNSALPILAATLLSKKQSVIHNCPNLSDISAAIEIIENFGCKVSRDNDTVTVDTDNIGCYAIPDNLMHKMRSSIVFLGAIISRCGKASMSFPGGCELGPRPIDLHLSSLRRLGVRIEEEHGYLHCITDGRLKGADIQLSIPSVGATENIMLAAVMAEGTTLIRNAAREPEISDLADYLNGCGARIQGAGESTIQIEGVLELGGTEHIVIPDRIAAATYMTAAAITRGKIVLEEVIPSHIWPVIPAFMEAGCEVGVVGRTITLIAPPRMGNVKQIRTMAYPGFPTDAQPPLMAMLTLGSGSSMFVENIFQNRYKHVGELTRLGARIKTEGRVAVVEGVQRLSGAPVESTDLRGGAALVVAGLMAEGITTVSGIEHIDRGYEDMEVYLTSLGADIKRKDD